MKIPPIDWDDLLTFGVSGYAEMSCVNGRFSLSPSPSKHISRLLSLMASSPPPDSATDRMRYLRHIRDALILATDWTQAPDAPLTVEQRAAWTGYRQALRDLPEVYSGSGPIPWPREPA